VKGQTPPHHNVGVAQPVSKNGQNGQQNVTNIDLKHSAKMYMNGLSQNVPNQQPIATVAHVIDPQWSIYNNSQKSMSSNENLPSATGSNVDKVYNQQAGVVPQELNGNNNANGGYHYIVSANPTELQPARNDPNLVTQNPNLVAETHINNNNLDNINNDQNSQPLQKSLIPVPISKEKDKDYSSTTNNEEKNQKQNTNNNKIINNSINHQQPEIANNSVNASVNSKSQTTKGSNMGQRRDSDGSITSQRSRPEIRSSSPFDRLLDGSNTDDVEELNYEENLIRPKSILKRAPSLESCQINVKDSLDIQSHSKRLVAKTPNTGGVNGEKRSVSAKRSVRFSETVQVQNKDEIDERMPRSHARAMSARAGVRTVAESPDRGSRKTAGGGGPKSAPLKPPAPSQNVPSEIEDIRNAQNSKFGGIIPDDESQYHLNKTPTDEEINALWESIRENMSASKRQQGTMPNYPNYEPQSGSTSHKPPVYISNNSTVGYYNNFIKPTNSPPAVASQYIDGSFLFAEQQGSSQQFMSQGGSQSSSSSRPTSAASIPRKQQHLLGQRQQQNANRPISGNASGNVTSSSRGSSGSNPAPNPPNTPVGNHTPFPGAPKTSSAAMFSPSSSSHNRTQQQNHQQHSKHNQQQQPAEIVSNSLAQFLAAEDLSNLASSSLSEQQIEDILGQLHSRRNVTQLSLEEQKLMMSLEHLNNKLKLAESRFKGQ